MIQTGCADISCESTCRNAAAGVGSTREDGQIMIHVVDDDLSVRRALERQLGSHGFRVQVYESADMFLRGCRISEPGCVLLDMNLKQSSGLDLQAELTGRGALFPVVFMTGSGATDLAERAMKGGARALLIKPFEDHELLACVHDALAEARRRFACDRHAPQAGSDSPAHPGQWSPEAQGVLDGAEQEVF
jgi:FixJ family two-component response regulator